MGVEAAAGETPGLIGEFVGETHRVLEHTQTHPPGNQHQKGPICLWVVEEITESQQRAKQVALFPLGPSFTYSITMQQCGLPCPGEHLRLHPLQYNRCAKTKENAAQMKEKIKTLKIQLSNEDAEFKTLVIKMLAEVTEYGH